MDDTSASRLFKIIDTNLGAVSLVSIAEYSGTS